MAAWEAVGMKYKVYLLYSFQITQNNEVAAQVYWCTAALPSPSG